MDNESGERNDRQENGWENRILCSDESCIGVIGPDGRCKECGRPYEGELPAAAAPEEDVPQPPTTASPEPVESEPAADEPGAAETDESWENRVLCSDESCIGIIGPDGRCKECGRPYEG